MSEEAKPGFLILAATLLVIGALIRIWAGEADDLDLITLIGIAFGGFLVGLAVGLAVFS